MKYAGTGGIAYIKADSFREKLSHLSHSFCWRTIISNKARGIKKIIKYFSPLEAGFWGNWPD